MAPRVQLQALFIELLGSNNVYFQPPPNLQMKYPCIVYKRDDQRIRSANNKPYSHRTRYQVTVIDQNPDSVIPSKIAELPLCVFDRFYTAENLNHDVYNIFF